MEEGQEAEPLGEQVGEEEGEEEGVAGGTRPAGRGRRWRSGGGGLEDGGLTCPGRVRCTAPHTMHHRGALLGDG